MTPRPNSAISFKKKNSPFFSTVHGFEQQVGPIENSETFFSFNYAQVTVNRA